MIDATDAEALARDYWPLAVNRAGMLRRRWPIAYRDPDDASSDALLALALAALSFDPGRDVHFATHYRSRLAGVVAGRWRRLRPRESSGVARFDALAVDPADPGSGDEIAAVDFRDLLDAVPEPSRSLLRRAMAGDDPTGIAREAGVPGRTARWRMARARRELAGVIEAIEATDTERRAH